MNLEVCSELSTGEEGSVLGDLIMKEKSLFHLRTKPATSDRRITLNYLLHTIHHVRTSDGIPPSSVKLQVFYK